MLYEVITYAACHLAGRISVIKSIYGKRKESIVMPDQIVTFILQVLNGLKIGSVYALVALGYTMVYGIIKLINFAHGDFIMVGSYALLRNNFV